MEMELLWKIHDVNRRREILEEECRLLSELLKPWPPKKSDKLQNIAVKSSTVEDLTQKSEEVNEEDREALMSVEKLLKKAQITLHNKPENVSAHDEKLDSDSSRSQSQDKLDKTDKLELPRKTQNHKALSKPHVSKLPNHNQPVREKGVMVDESQRTSTRGSTKQDNMGQGRGKVASKPGQLVSHNHSHRSIRPGSGRNRHQPVHLSAPFKTDERTKVPSKTVMQSHYRHKNVSRPQSRSAFGSKTPQPYTALPAIKKDTKMCCEQFDDMENVEINQVNYIVDSKTSDMGEVNSNNHADVLSDKQEVEYSATCVASSAESFSVEDQPDASTREEQAERFILQRDGSSLKLPSKLSKLVNTNYSLRDQCCSVKLVKKVSSEDRGAQFIDRLESQWEISEEMWTRVRAIACVKSHKIILGMLHNLINVSDQASYQELYRAKRILEFGLAIFSGLQDESEYLSQVQFKEPHTQFQSKRNVTTKTVIDGVALEEQANHDWDVTESLKGCPKWSDLKFQQEYLQLQLWLFQMINTHWWHSRLFDEKDTTVLQSLYSLLSSGGQFLPAFISNGTS